MNPARRDPGRYGEVVPLPRRPLDDAGELEPTEPRQAPGRGFEVAPVRVRPPARHWMSLEPPATREDWRVWFYLATLAPRLALMSLLWALSSPERLAGYLAALVVLAAVLDLI
ncbi:MAG: hypothetical protein ACRDPK_00550 [Carbonactinosporaceae bacterium]